MTMSKHRQCLRAGAVVSALMLSGCGQPDHGFNLAQVSGTITYNGEPLDDALVAFDPEGGGRIASGRTDAEGHYKLTTVDEYDGAIVGRHGVRVVKRVAAKAPHLPQPDAYAPLIPEKYFNVSTSGLTAEVVDGESNVFNFTLADDAESGNQQAAQSR